MIATLADTADKHFHLLSSISPGKFYSGNHYIFEACRIAATVTDKMNMVILVKSTGTVVFT